MSRSSRQLLPTVNRYSGRDPTDRGTYLEVIFPPQECAGSTAAFRAYLIKVRRLTPFPMRSRKAGTACSLVMLHSGQSCEARADAIPSILVASVHALILLAPKQQAFPRRNRPFLSVRINPFSDGRRDSLNFVSDPSLGSHFLRLKICGTVPTRRALATLDDSGPRSESPRVESAAMKVVGKLDKTPWQRFARLQRSAARLSAGRGQPKGVFRFATNEACSQWTANLNRTAK